MIMILIYVYQYHYHADLYSTCNIIYLLTTLRSRVCLDCRYITKTLRNSHSFAQDPRPPTNCEWWGSLQKEIIHKIIHDAPATGTHAADVARSGACVVCQVCASMVLWSMTGNTHEASARVQTYGFVHTNVCIHWAQLIVRNSTEVRRLEQSYWTVANVWRWCV